MPTLVFVGTVFSGRGEGKKFVSLPWVKRQIEEKAGFVPFAGTLNLHLNAESIKQKPLLQKAQRMEIVPEEGFCPGFLVNAQVFTVVAAVVLPQVPDYPNDVLEVIAPFCLREEFGVADGSTIIVMVKV